MANKEAMLDKIARNLKQRGLAESVVVRGATSVSVTKTGGDVLTISYVDKSVQSPMGGVSASAAPYLGIGIAAPGSLKVKGAAAETTIAAIVDTTEALQVLAVLSGFGNDVIIESGASTAELARIAGTSDLLGMGM
jgi:hypothetical protein